MTIEEIQRKTAEFYKLDLRELHSPRRARRVARPRQVAMYLARELTSRSLPDIGRRFGGRDHTTVLHACRRIAELCRSDPMFQQEVDFLRKVLGHSQRIVGCFPPAPRGWAEPHLKTLLFPEVPRAFDAWQELLAGAFLCILYAAESALKQGSRTAGLMRPFSGLRISEFL